ncbi:MAG: 2-amino-4-hydroxy-6-hydroxymethyldihydropteridine diphosphokinase [Spirochaetes bacterium]|nr:2-amino-4-hydroxy-6-hydroxymethyldihydropteridine diphosphokinase [Spirochaetota bacterium]
MPLVYIGLGSNLGDRRGHIDEATRRLRERTDISVIRESSVLETDPVDCLNQPKFLNKIVLVETCLDPTQLLKTLQEIEDAMGRRRTVDKGPRVIDLDLLLHGDTILDTERLTLPHPGVRRRRFILTHLVELDPELRDPATGAKYSLILQKYTGRLP